MHDIKWWFCNGIVYDKNYQEKTCPVRDNCCYYDEMFYVKHSDRLDEFGLLTCIEPCGYYVARKQEESKEVKPNPF